jgi:glycosyltransferase involved in cell wall biosynthesis
VGPIPIHVVEPTLVDQTGHCHSFVGAVCASGPEQCFEVWAGRRVGPLFADLPNVHLHPLFVRKLRRVQLLLLYRKLLRAPGRIFVPTAGTTDLALLHTAARRPLPPGKATLFFHWIRASDSKRRKLRALATRQPELGVMAATVEIVELLREAGFRRATLVPYPLTPSARRAQIAAPFRHLLFAGAARMDKGFTHVVDLAERLAQAGESIPLSIQTSARHYGKLDPEVARELARLERAHYAALHTHSQTLESKAYLELFAGAICLQPYDRAEFAGRVSAVTVDALACGAPILTTSGTWMGRTVTRFEAGLALDSLDTASIHTAVKRLIADYDRFSAGARRAAPVVHAEHSARHLLDAVIAPPAAS